LIVCLFLLDNQLNKSNLELGEHITRARVATLSLCMASFIFVVLLIFESWLDHDDDDIVEVRLVQTESQHAAVSATSSSDEYSLLDVKVVRDGGGEAV